MKPRDASGNVFSAVVPRDRVHQAAAPVRIPAPHSGESAHAGAEPRIELIRTGDVIEAIDITCTCGQRIRVRCDYRH